MAHDFNLDQRVDAPLPIRPALTDLHVLMIADLRSRHDPQSIKSWVRTARFLSVVNVKVAVMFVARTTDCYRPRNSWHWSLVTAGVCPATVNRDIDTTLKSRSCISDGPSLIHVIPHAREEIKALAARSNIVSLSAVDGWNVQEWELTTADVQRVVKAYQAILSVDLDADLDQLLIDLGVDRLGPKPDSEQHAKVARADAIELVAAATVVAVEQVGLDDIHMPNVPKMATKKSDSGIDVLGVELDSNEVGDLVAGERLVLVSVKHTIGKYASGMRSKLEASLKDDLSGPYIYRQLTNLQGRMIQAGVPEATANRVIYFMRETLSNPNVRIIGVAAAEPDPDCNLQDQTGLLEHTDSPDAHFRMLLVPGLKALHTKLVP